MFWPTRDQTTPTRVTSGRELDRRVNDVIEVRLLWSEHDETLWVAGSDTKAGAEFSVEVRDRGRALDVFHHPYTYAAHYRVDTYAKPVDAALASLVSIYERVGQDDVHL